MTETNHSVRQVIILADETAGWEVAGLAQLERLVLAVNDWAKGGREVELSIFWQPGGRTSGDVQSVRSFLPLGVITPGEEITGDVCLLSTRLCPFPGDLDETVKAFTVTIDSTIEWPALFELHSGRKDAAPAGGQLKWRWLNEAGQIPAVETELLRGLAKPQDGLVSRWLNRPLSRAVTRYLLQSSISPGAWTIAILILPVIGFFVLLDGRYLSIVVGCILLQLFSVLDGCDGEMARAKYLETPNGALLDHFCDQIGNVLFLLGLGLGLYRMREWGDRYFLESVFCTIALVLNEITLWRWKNQRVAQANLMESAYRRHQGVIEHSGIQILGRRGVSILFQLTKRDVSVLVFLLLAIVGLPQWILHLWLAVSLGSFALTLVAVARAAGRRGT